MPILESNCVVNIWAIMVKVSDASIRDFTVLCPRWFDESACVTKSVQWVVAFLLPPGVIKRHLSDGVFVVFCVSS